MGSDAEVYIFDDAAYRERVVPAVIQFVDTGVAESWMEALLVRAWGDTWAGEEDVVSRIRGLGFSFAAVCHYLEADFAYPDVQADRKWYDLENILCRSTVCPARAACPLHEGRGWGGLEQFNSLLEACIIDQCLGSAQFLGRSKYPLWYTDLLHSMGIAPAHPIFDYLHKLAHRGYVVGYMFANSDGAHGWLTAAETREFYALLRELDLPKFEASFEVMHTLLRAEQQRKEPVYGASEDRVFARLSLAFLRTVAELATAQGKGILWGNDVGPWWD